MRILYSLAWWLSLPLILVRLWWRGRKEPGYRRYVAERLGFYGNKKSVFASRTVIWIHAVSVGETRAAAPLVEALLQASPDYRLLLTHMTPTGRAAGNALYGHQARVAQRYLPYDTGWMVGRFLARYQPRLCLLMETEIWPNLIAQCGRHQVPVALVNARLSERSLAKAKRLSRLMTEAARGLSCVGAQSEPDAMRLREAGASNVQVTGSIKFDVLPSPAILDRGKALRASFGARPVLLCASTREGEEVLILDAFAAATFPHAVRDLLLVIAPRHPHRFDAVAGLIAERGLPMLRRSALQSGREGKTSVLPAQVRVVLGDTMGEMFAYYAACDVAFVGGSLLPLGGQNLIEACAVGTPVLTGPYTFNFEAVTNDAIAAGAALRVRDAQALITQAADLMQQAAALGGMGHQAQAFALRHRGATRRTMQLLWPWLPPVTRE